MSDSRERDRTGAGARSNSLAYLTSNLALSLPLPTVFLFPHLYPPTIIPFLLSAREELPGGDRKIEIVATDSGPFRLAKRFSDKSLFERIMILNPKSHHTVSINAKVVIYIIYVIYVTGTFNFSANAILNEIIWTYQSIFHIIVYLIIPDKANFSN